MPPVLARDRDLFAEPAAFYFAIVGFAALSNCRRCHHDELTAGDVKRIGAAAAAWTSSGRYAGPIFRRVTRSGAVSGHAPLTTSAVRAIVRKRPAAVGVEGAGGHSCRVGRAQSLIERGASTAAVAIAGRCKDPGIVVRYAKAQEAGRGAVKAYFGGK